MTGELRPPRGQYLVWHLWNQPQIIKVKLLNFRDVTPVLE